jgi:hypothetical protein
MHCFTWGGASVSWHFFFIAVSNYVSDCLHSVRWLRTMTVCDFCRIVWVQLMFCVTHSIFGPNLRQWICRSAFFTTRPSTVSALIRQDKNNTVKKQGSKLKKRGKKLLFRANKRLECSGECVIIYHVSGGNIWGYFAVIFQELREKPQ